MLPQVTFLPILGLSVCLCKIRSCSWIIPNVPSTFRSRSFMPLMLIPHLPQNLNGRNATGHIGGAEMAFYCWGWRVTSIVCPDCEEEYLRVSFDWAHLSLLGDGGSTDRPRGRWYRDSVTSLGINLEEDPSVRHGHPGSLPAPAFTRHSYRSASSQTPRAQRLREGLAPGTEHSPSLHPPTPSP